MDYEIAQRILRLRAEIARKYLSLAQLKERTGYSQSNISTVLNAARSRKDYEKAKRYLNGGLLEALERAVESAPSPPFE